MVEKQRAGSKTNKKYVSTAEKTKNYIKKARAKHGDRYDYSKCNFLDWKTKVIIICKLHGEFSQRPQSHLSGHKCRKCSILEVSKKNASTTDEFIEKAKKIHGDEYNYDSVVYINCQKKVEIICMEHNSFFMRPQDHLRGQKCPKCGIKNGADKLRSSIEEFVSKANIVHNNKYQYDKAVYINTGTKLIITCKKHNYDFTQIPSNHLNGNGCPICNNHTEKPKDDTQPKIFTKETFIEDSIKKHGGKYDYSLVEFVNMKTEVKIMCQKNHHIFTQKPTAHTRGTGCPLCATKDRTDKLCSTTIEFIKKANIIHDFEYDYSKVNYINTNTKVKIICDIHGEFNMVPYSHLRGAGCKKCGIEYIADNRRLSTEEFISKANAIHNNKYLYDKAVYVNCMTKLIITCRQHGPFLQRAGNHLNGSDCPKCIRHGYSKASIEWLDYVSKKENIYIQHAENIGEHKISNSKYKADGYCPDTNTIYEFYGCLYHGCKICFDENKFNPLTNMNYGDLYEKTIEREKFIKSQNYNLVTIWEHEWWKIKKQIKLDKINCIKTNDNFKLLFNIIDQYDKNKEIQDYLADFAIKIPGITTKNISNYGNSVQKILLLISKSTTVNQEIKALI